MPTTIEGLTRDRLAARKLELSERLERIKASVRRTHDADSEERAIELENVEVVDALGNETRRELQMIEAAMRRIDDGHFGHCSSCGEIIHEDRLTVQPCADVCIDCAELDEELASRPT